LKFTFSGGLKIVMNFDEKKNLITEVSDTGIGIIPDDLEKLFKFFGCITKSKDINRGGMGLGLTISKMIIQQLQGDISVTSEPNKGSTFSFKIPIYEFISQGDNVNNNNNIQEEELLNFTEV